MQPIAPWYQLGYIIPHRHTDMDACQFYRVAPEGMLLVSTGLDLAEYSLASVEAQLPAFHSAVDLLAHKPVDRIALSGVPVASVLGRTRMRALLAQAAESSGLEVDTDLEAHIATLQQNKAAGPLADHALALELGREALAAAPQAQALLMPGGLWFAIHAVAPLEAEFGRPVLLNILSTTCSALRAHAARAGAGAVPRADARWGMVLASA